MTYQKFNKNNKNFNPMYDNIRRASNSRIKISFGLETFGFAILLGMALIFPLGFLQAVFTMNHISTNGVEDYATVYWVALGLSLATAFVSVFVAIWRSRVYGKVFYMIIPIVIIFIFICLFILSTVILSLGAIGF